MPLAGILRLARRVKNASRLRRFRPDISVPEDPRSQTREARAGPQGVHPSVDVQHEKVRRVLYFGRLQFQQSFIPPPQRGKHRSQGISVDMLGWTHPPQLVENNARLRLAPGLRHAASLFRLRWGISEDMTQARRYC